MRREVICSCMTDDPEGLCEVFFKQAVGILVSVYTRGLDCGCRVRLEAMQRCLRSTPVYSIAGS